METNTFRVIKWDETYPEEGMGGPRVAPAHTTMGYEGVMEGTGVCDHVLYYGPDSSGWYHGYEHFTGTVNSGGSSRTGSFVLAHTGEFDAKGVRTEWSVVPGSGKDGLEGVNGKGGFDMEHGSDPGIYTMEASFDTN